MSIFNSKFYRSSKKMIDKSVRGFWKHPSHIQKLFKYLTKVPSLLENIQKGLRRQTELMERYLLRQDKKGGKISDRMIQLEEECLTEFDGSKETKYVEVMRMFANSIDMKGDGRALFLYNTEESVNEAGEPYLKVFIVDK